MLLLTTLAAVYLGISRVLLGASGTLGDRFVHVVPATLLLVFFTFPIVLLAADGVVRAWPWP